MMPMNEKIIRETEERTTVEHPKVVRTTRIENTPVTTEPPQRVFEKKKTIFRTYQVIWYILAVIEILLAFRTVLKAIGANPASGFTLFIYAISAPLALPFSGILPTSVSGNSVFEWSNIIAAVVYVLLAYGIIHFLQMAKPVTPTEVEETVDNP